MTEALPEPQQRLPEAAIGLWRLVLGLWAAGLFIASLALAPAADDLGVPVWLAPAVVLVVGVVAVVLVPRLRWRRWRYDIRDDETGGAPAYYMVNCAHPSHFEAELEGDAAWLERLRGLRANASTCNAWYRRAVAASMAWPTT